jgi:hypothetical protein
MYGLLRRIIAEMLFDVNTMCWLAMTGGDMLFKPIFCVTIAMNKGLLMNAEDMDKIKLGMIIFYNLPLSYKPRKPLREWERS